MRAIPAQDVIDAVANAAVEANYHLEDDMREALKSAQEREVSTIGRSALDQIVENAAIADQDKFPICQDTGLSVVFVQMGEDVRVEGGLKDAITEGVRKGVEEGYLRRTVCDPFTRANTGDSTPAIIHIDLVPGDKLVIEYLAKGGGSENMSRAGMLTPAAGVDGVVDYVVEVVRTGAVNACPPISVGVGIGGDLEMAAILAKKTLARPLGQPSDEPRCAEIERRVLEAVNKLGVGPAGLGGRVTALAVHAELMPCHIASLPVAVVLQCHAHRHRRIEL